MTLTSAAVALPVQAKWMNEEKEMTEQIVGGNVFEFTTEFVHLTNESTVPLEPLQLSMGEVVETYGEQTHLILSLSRYGRALEEEG